MTTVVAVLEKNDDSTVVQLKLGYWLFGSCNPVDNWKRLGRLVGSSLRGINL